MTDTDQGGDPPCWAHLFENADNALSSGGDPLVMDLSTIPPGSGGVICSLPYGGDLNVNLVRLDPGGEIGAHVNDEVDVLLVAQTGNAELVVNGEIQQLTPNLVVLIPKGTQRWIAAGETGITYLSIHRQRDPLGITSKEKHKAR